MAFPVAHSLVVHHAGFAESLSDASTMPRGYPANDRAHCALPIISGACPKTVLRQKVTATPYPSSDFIYHNILYRTFKSSEGQSSKVSSSPMQMLLWDDIL